MTKWIKIAINERKVTFLLSLMVLVFGVYTYYFMPKQENPDTSSPTAQIITIFPGATASEVESLITKKVEDELSMLDGIEYMTSYSNPNVSVVIVTLNYEVDYDEQWAKMRVALDALKPKLPQNVLDYEINTDLTTSAGIILSLSGNQYTYEQLAEFAQSYKTELERIDGVKRITIDGAPEKEVVVTIDSEKIALLPISNKDIYDLLQAQNLSIPVGEIVTPDGKVGIKTPGLLQNISDIERIIVSGSSESPGFVRIGDVANVEFSYKANTQRYLQGDERAVLLTVYFKSDENVILIGEDVRALIDRISMTQPEALQIDEILFQPQEVSLAIEGFMINLLQGVIFVVLVVLIGMGIRNAIVVSAAIPLSIMMTLAAMQILGIEIQQMSIAALIISLGILVDNSIVISDAIQIKINEDIERGVACYEGTIESAIPVLTSTLTTIAAFAPLMILPGEAGEFAKSLPQVVIISLIASYIVAMLVTPALASVFFKKSSSRYRNRNRFRHFFEYLLKGSLRMPKFTIVVVVIILGITAYFIQFLSIELFPYADKDIIYIDLFAEKNGDIDFTEALVNQLKEALNEEVEIKNIASSIGGGFPKFYLTVGVRPPADNYAQLLLSVDLSKGNRFTSRENYAYYLQNLCDSVLSGGSATVSLLEINQPGPAIDIKVSGQNREDVNRVSKEIYAYLLSDINALNVQSDVSEFAYQYKVDVDQDLATSFGLTNYDIQFQMGLAVNGMTSTILQTSGNQYNIVVKDNIENIQDLMQLQIKSSFNEEKVMLKQMAKVALEKELVSIKRHNRRASVSVTSNVQPGYAASDLQRTIEDQVLPNINLEGVEISFGGDQEIFDKYISGLLGAAIFALVVIYIILLIQFNSLIQPLIILMTVPLSIVGSVFILLILNMKVTFTVGLGVASLIGIVVNNAILLIEYINRERKMEHAVYDACINSVEKRFRPIMLSTITTIIGLVPLALSNSSFFTPMAVALMGGLMVSTLLTLIVIPVTYYIIEKK